MYNFVPNKLFGPLLDILTKSFVLLKAFTSKFSPVEVWFTGGSSNPLEKESKINLKTKCLLKLMDFLLLQEK